MIREVGIPMKPASDVRFASTPEGGVLLDLCSDQFFTVNQAGAQIWSLLGEGRCRSEIAGILASRTGIDIGAATSDVDAFVQELTKRNLLNLRSENR